MDLRQAEQIEWLSDALGEHSRMVQESRYRIKTFSSSFEKDLDYQREMISAIRNGHSSGHPLFALEAATGCGKTYVAGQIAESTPGHVIYICHKTYFLEQIRQKFLSIMPDEIREMGHPNEFSAAHRIHFLTPWKLLALKRRQSLLLKALVEKTGLLIVDESHHYPADSHNRLKVYGEVEKFASELVQKGAKILSITGSHLRLDGMRPMGVSEPHYRFTIQDAVNAGICPPIYGMQVRIDVTPISANRIGDMIDVQMDDRGQETYLKTVADHVVHIWKHEPAPFCVFMSRVSHAKQIVQEFNKATGLGDKGIALLTGETSNRQRLGIRDRILSGDLCGYVTVNVGSESMDIPPLEVVHMCAKTASTAKLMQAVGRGTRSCKGKKRLLVVDYHFLRHDIVDGCVGNYEYAKEADSWVVEELGSDMVMRNGPLVLPDEDQQNFVKWAAYKDVSDESLWIGAHSAPASAPASAPNINNFGQFSWQDAYRHLQSIRLPRLPGKTAKEIYEAWHDGKLKGYQLPPRGLPRDLEAAYGRKDNEDGKADEKD